MTGVPALVGDTGSVRRHQLGSYPTSCRSGLQRNVLHAPQVNGRMLGRQPPVDVRNTGLKSAPPGTIETILSIRRPNCRNFNRVQLLHHWRRRYLIGGSICHSTHTSFGPFRFVCLTSVGRGVSSKRTQPSPLAPLANSRSRWRVVSIRIRSKSSDKRSMVAPGIRSQSGAGSCGDVVPIRHPSDPKSRRS